MHARDDERECRSYWKRVVPLDDYDLTIVKKPSMPKKPSPQGTIAIRHDPVCLLRQIKGDVSEPWERLIGIPRAAPSLLPNKKRYKGNRI